MYVYNWLQTKFSVSVQSVLCIGMTDNQRQSIYRFRKLKAAQGWRVINTLVPPDVKEKVMAYKRLLMTHYHIINSTKQ
jgi:hypothetical protein